jgi:hypothetical protein
VHPDRDAQVLKHVVEVIDLDDGRHSATKLKEVRDFLHRQLRTQEYVRGALPRAPFRGTQPVDFPLIY